MNVEEDSDQKLHFQPSGFVSISVLTIYPIIAPFGAFEIECI